MKKWNAFFLLLAVSLCATMAVLAEQPIEFPAGYITGEQTELVSEHFRVSIEPGVYVPGDLTEYLEKIYNAIETASGIRFEDGPYYRTISVVCHAKAVSEEGEGYVPSAYQNRVILYPPDILENGNYAIIHELSHVLNYFYHKASQPWESTLIAEGFAEYNTYKTIQWIEKNDLALAYAVGTSNQVLLNTMLNDEETLYSRDLMRWMKRPYPYSGNPGYSEGLRFMAYLDQVYGNYTDWMQTLAWTLGGTVVEKEVSALKGSYGEAVLEGFYPWLKENSAQFHYGDMYADVDLRGVQQMTLYPTFNNGENSAKLSKCYTLYSDLYVDLSQAMMNLRDDKGKDVSAAQLHVECTTTADVFDVEGNVLATIHWQYPYG